MFYNLKAEMSRKDLKPIDIANILGCSERTAKNYINRKTKITWFDVLKIQSELFPECEIQYLFDMSDVKEN